ncbi:hypothetical protein LCL89_03245 [Halobacillus yeomjeoni]|uniref:Uncharacterized protein n=1 Tax=Halobacillus yeomjeoni TaxID=311194 RepID=A0A931HUC8_9BACI|nr:hypothetical protein [Halobacillus yeomjeoni]MBH0229549.1 hypothetical protein [Halobacillus yeomjeoni]MCA0983060.1 hypothetical protein [Halobacillus yeomjeoni]
MVKTRVVTPLEFEEQIFQLKEKFSLLERRLSLKADEIVFTMAVAHRKEIDELKDEVFHLREQLKTVKKEQQDQYLERIAYQAKKRSVV